MPILNWTKVNFITIQKFSCQSAQIYKLLPCFIELVRRQHLSRNWFAIRSMNVLTCKKKVGAKTVIQKVEGFFAANWQLLNSVVQIFSGNLILIEKNFLQQQK